MLRPLFFEFPDDQMTYNIDQQFMVGRNLLVSPVTSESSDKLSFYVPKGRWFDFFTRRSIGCCSNRGEWLTQQVPLSDLKIPIYIRAGSVIPTQDPRMTIYETARTDYELLVSLDANGNARGYLYADDGDSGDVDSQSSLVLFNLKRRGTAYSFNSTVLRGGFGPDQGAASIRSIVFMGVMRRPTDVRLNEAPLQENESSFSSQDQTLQVTLSPSMPITSSFVLEWTKEISIINKKTQPTDG